MYHANNANMVFILLAKVIVVGAIVSKTHFKNVKNVRMGIS